MRRLLTTSDYLLQLHLRVRQARWWFHLAEEGGLINEEEEFVSCDSLSNYLVMLWGF